MKKKDASIELQMMNEEATLTEIQSIRQKMAEAYHIQRQYKTILDVISTERIGYESQLMDLEKSTAEAKLEAAKLKVRFEHHAVAQLST